MTKNPPTRGCVVSKLSEFMNHHKVQYLVWDGPNGNEVDGTAVSHFRLSLLAASGRNGKLMDDGQNIRQPLSQMQDEAEEDVRVFVCCFDSQ